MVFGGRQLIWDWPCIQTGSRLPGTVWRGLIFFTTDRPDYHRMPPPARGQSRLSGFCCAHRLCVRSPCQHISRMRTFDNNSCAISITSPRSIFVPGTQHVWWGRREKSRRASTRCDCRGKSRLAGLSPLSGTPSERGVNHVKWDSKCQQNAFAIVCSSSPLDFGGGGGGHLPHGSLCTSVPKNVERVCFSDVLHHQRFS